MKKALVLLDEYAKLWNIDYKFIGNIHDEIQTEVREEEAEVFGRLAVSCIEASGQHYKLLSSNLNDRSDLLVRTFGAWRGGCRDGNPP